MADSDVYVAAGSNVEPDRHLPAAFSSLAAVYGPISCSRAYRSAPVGFEGPDFVNCVVRMRTGVSPEALIRHLKLLESHAGRRTDQENASRELDLDLILYGDAVIERNGMTIPRSDVLRYAFVLRPLAELAPDAIHPRTRRSFAWHWANFEGEPITLEPVTLRGI